MANLLKPITCTMRNDVDRKHLPQYITMNSVYPVIAVKSVVHNHKDKIREGVTRAVEELYFGIVDDEGSLVFVPSFNVKVQISN